MKLLNFDNPIVVGKSLKSYQGSPLSGPRTASNHQNTIHTDGFTIDKMK